MDDGETTTLLGDDEHKKYVPPGKIHLWWRNPIFYTSVLFSFFSFILLIIHATWIFHYGVILSAASGVVFGIGVIYYVTSRWNVRSYNRGMTGFEIFKFSLLILIVLGAQAVLIWYQSTLLRIHVNAPDPDWRDFPFKCAENSQNLTILNCVRVGPGVPNPYTNKGLDPCLTVPTYNGTLSDVTAMFVDVIRTGLGCKVIAYNESIGFLHARCLTTFQGYPDDLALKFQCEAGVTMVWIHSQSRLGWWDFNFNDARVRVLLQYIELWELDNLKTNVCRPNNGTQVVI